MQVDDVNVEQALKELLDVLEDNEEIKVVLLAALRKIQGFVRDARSPNTPPMPASADEIRKAAVGAVKNLRRSQSTKEKFYEVVLSTGADIIALLETVLADDEENSGL